LGTSFNIRAYADEKNTEVAVVTGKVKMEEVSSGASQLLTPHQKGIVSKGESLKRTTFEFHQVIGWKDGILIFEKDPFLDVFKKLQAWYGIEIEVDDNVVLKGHYSGEFQHDSLENIMQGIAFTSGFSYKIVDKKVFIMAK
jgi:ferric-dicitrate binding protein FerR (iron transport regulator)